MSDTRGVLENLAHRDPDVAAELRRLQAAAEAEERPPEFLEPNGDRILVRPDRGQQEFAGGKIVLLEAEKLARGQVVAIGTGRWHGEQFEEIPYVVGDRLLWGKYAGQKIELNGEELIVIRLDDVIGLIGVASDDPASD